MRAVLLLVLAGVLACDKQPEDGKTVDDARAFVVDFYAWYLQPQDKGGAGTNLETAVKARPQLFDSTLLAALREDISASAASPGELVGLDFDPFVYSQDPCDQYVADASTSRGYMRLVPVNEVCGGKPTRTPALRAEVIWNGDSWQFVDLLYEDTNRLLLTLAKLKAERANP